MKEALEAMWVEVWWCGGADCEARVKEDTRATLRVIPFKQPEGETGRCIVCGEAAHQRALFARAY